MEGSLNIFKLQSVMQNILERTGDFSKIKYKGGNEEKISTIVKTLQEYFALKELLVNNKANAKYVQQLQHITSLLIMNTEFKNKDSLLSIKEFSPLMKAIPSLSKCVLANIIIELDLTKSCCALLLTLPFQIGEELLSEVVTCVRQCEPDKALQDTCSFLDTIIKILITLDGDRNQLNEEIIDGLADVACEILTNISGLNTDYIEKWQTLQINKHMGHTFLCLMKLLRNCPMYTSSLNRIIDDLIRVATTIWKAVTLEVFCTWAEVKYEHHQPLQMVICGEAYMTVEHLQKYKPAQELIQMLGSMARKPKTINEIILEADLAAMISSINKCDDNQKLWFRAFMNTNVLQNEEALTCLNRWAHLCAQDDVTRVLNLSVCHKDLRIKKLVMKCARSLSIKELEVVAARYLREHNTNNLASGSLKDQLTLLLNKMQSSSEVDDDFMKEIYLLLIQNAEFVITVLYTECLKKVAAVHYLKKVFESIKPVIEVHRLSKTVLIKVLKSHPFTLENIACCKELLNLLLSLQYFPDDVVLFEILLPQMQEFLNEDNYEKLSYMLQLLNLISIKHTLNQNILPVIALLSNILEKTRCQFFTFSIISQGITQEVVEFLWKYKSAPNNVQNMQYKDFLSTLEVNEPVNKFYLENLYRNSGNQLLSYVYPRFVVDNHEEVITKLMKLLPTCVASEWILIAKELESECGFQRTLSLLEGTVILLCYVTKSQAKHKDTAVSNGLKFCLQQFGIIIKNVLQPTHTGLEDEILVTKSVCKILKDIPSDVRKEEGLGLVGLLSQQSLQALKDDKAFVVQLFLIDDLSVSQVLAQKMLA